ncbi:MAG: energy transducer TonB [Chitinophagaceae bacterium]|nr:energy transducer TonB [Chitinophagaceae bacterium]
MDINTFMRADFTDIVFLGRNKEYGAYELKKNYQRRMLISLFLGLLSAFSLLLFVSSIKHKKDSSTKTSSYNGITLIETEFQKELPKPQKELSPVNPKGISQKTNQIKNVPPKIVEDHHKNPDDVMPAQEDLKITQIGTETVRNGAGSEPSHTTQGNTGPETNNLSEVFSASDIPLEYVETPAEYEGNWKRFLESHLYPEVPVRHGAPEGQYSVIIRFVVDIDGSLSEIEPLTRHGYGMKEEAVRVIKKSKKWKPAILKNQKVKAWRKQVITFIVKTEE